MRGKYGRFFTIVTLFGLTTFSTTTGRPRSPGMVVPATIAVQEKTKVQPLVDGSKNPELIPDNLALRSFLQTIVVPPNPSDSDTRRLRSQVARMNLNQTDLKVLSEGLGRLHGKLTDQRARIAEKRRLLGDTPTPSKVNDVLKEDDKVGVLVADSYNELLRLMSQGGAEKLREQLAYVKTRMKIFPTPDMSGHAGH